MTEEIESAAGRLAPSVTEATYEELRLELRRAVARVCPRWLSDRCEDLIQIALMRVVALREKSEGIREFSSSYLRKVAYSALVDEIRALRRRQEVPLNPEVAENVAGRGNDSPERHLAGRQIATAILECLARLRRARRRAVTLYLEGHTVPQTARYFGWTLKRAENLVYRGLGDLRECLAQRGFAP